MPAHEHPLSPHLLSSLPTHYPLSPLTPNPLPSLTPLSLPLSPHSLTLSLTFFSLPTLYLSHHSLLNRSLLSSHSFNHTHSPLSQLTPNSLPTQSLLSPLSLTSHYLPHSLTSLHPTPSLFSPHSLSHHSLLIRSPSLSLPSFSPLTPH